jgi:ectoine hydroxylase-related dioxygenase (phytanoyl-CoA dioxygenase family)
MERILPSLTAGQRALDLSPERFGFLESSTHLIGDPAALRARMDAEGYLFLPGALHRDEVLAARRVCAERLAAKKMLREGSDPMDCLIRPGQDTGFDISLAKDNAPLMKVLYDGPMMAVCEQLIGGPVLHFDYTWFRAVAPNRSTPPHMDIVYMGRGTQRLYTAWTPIGDVPLETGGLLVLERSHKHERLNNGYGRKDVDTYCENRREPGWTEMGGGGNIRAGGALSNDPIKLRDRLGGRWLTADFAAGDVLLFSVFTVHCSLDNRSQSIRLSSDSRYQSAAEPADHRWIGPDPIAHGPAGKRGMIC